MSIERCRACAEIERFIEQTEGNSENKEIASGKIDPVSQSASQPAASFLVCRSVTNSYESDFKVKRMMGRRWRMGIRGDRRGRRRPKVSGHKVQARPTSSLLQSLIFSPES